MTWLALRPSFSASSFTVVPSEAKISELGAFGTSALCLRRWSFSSLSASISRRRRWGGLGRRCPGPLLPGGPPGGRPGIGGRMPRPGRGRGMNLAGRPGVGAGMPGIGAALALRWTSGWPGTSTLDRVGAAAAGRPLAAPGRNLGPGGRSGRTGTGGRMLLVRGRLGCGVPGTTTGLTLTFGLSGGLTGGAACWIRFGAAFAPTEGFVPATGGGVPFPAGAFAAAGLARWTVGVGIDGALPPSGTFGTLGRPGTRLMLGRGTSGPIAVTGIGSGFLRLGSGRSEARVAASGLAVGPGGRSGGASGGRACSCSCSCAGAGATAGVATGFLGATGGRNAFIGGRNCRLGGITGIEGRTDAAAPRPMRGGVRPIGMRDLFGKGSSSSGRGGSGSFFLR